LIGLVIVFSISLGMCGLTVVLVWRGGGLSPGMNRLLNRMAALDMLGMVLSVVGMVVTTIIWVAMSGVNRSNRKEP
jgi:hypothetical protein